MTDNYSVKINRRDGAIEVTGDKEWVDEKLTQLSTVLTGPIETVGGESDHEPIRDEKPTRKRPTRKPKAAGEAGDGKKQHRRTGSPTVLRDLDLAPKGKKSFKAFVQEKQPKTQHDKNVVSVYYLTQIAKIGPVTTSHVLTCYRDMTRDWRLPADVPNSLALTTNRKRFLDTSDMQNIMVTPAGFNQVEQDLPPKKKGD